MLIPIVAAQQRPLRVGQLLHALAQVSAPRRQPGQQFLLAGQQRLDGLLVQEPALLGRQEELLPRLTTRRAYLRECLEELPDAPRQLVRGYYWDEQDVDALAGQSGRTAEAIYKALQRIRQALSDCMNRKAREEGASA